MTQPLHVRYRPTAFEEVVGQEKIAKSMEKSLLNGDSRAFLLAGPSGVGKTTLARIAAQTIKCNTADIIEIDAATRTSIDDVREIQKAIQFKPFGESQTRAVIVDECHRLSAQARDSLLKIIEEPPEGVYWFLCTTEPGKVPTTIKTRCMSYTLKPVGEKDLGDLLDWVIDEENIEMDEDVADLCVHESNGSPRQLLVNIAMCRDTSSKKEAAELLRTARESDPVRELCQLLLKNGSWGKAMSIIGKMETESPESVRIIVCHYMTTVLKSATNENNIRAALDILSAFREDAPWNQSEGHAPLVYAVGSVLFGD